ncbi:MAG: hypothetical protein ACLQVJ_15125 [Syntrophobacteraceae bacterium]
MKNEKSTSLSSIATNRKCKKVKIARSYERNPPIHSLARRADSSDLKQEGILVQRRMHAAAKFGESVFVSIEGQRCSTLGEHASVVAGTDKTPPGVTPKKKGRFKR